MRTARFAHSTMMRSAHSREIRRLRGWQISFPIEVRSVSETPRAREQAPQAKTCMCRPVFRAFRREAANGQNRLRGSRFGQQADPDLVSGFRKDQSVEKGNAALVGSSAPHALFIMIFQRLFGLFCFRCSQEKGQTGWPSQEGACCRRWMPGPASSRRARTHDKAPTNSAKSLAAPP
jgi:hypothetical protein